MAATLADKRNQLAGILEQLAVFAA